MRFFKPGDTVLCIKTNHSYIEGQRYKVGITVSLCYPSRELTNEENRAVIQLHDTFLGGHWANHDMIFSHFKLVSIGKPFLPEWL